MCLVSEALSWSVLFSHILLGANGHELWLSKVSSTLGLRTPWQSPRCLRYHGRNAQPGSGRSHGWLLYETEGPLGFPGPWWNFWLWCFHQTINLHWKLRFTLHSTQKGLSCKLYTLKGHVDFEVEWLFTLVTLEENLEYCLHPGTMARLPTSGVHWWKEVFCTYIRKINFWLILTVICLYFGAPPHCCYPVHRFVLVPYLFNKGSLILISSIYFCSPKCLVYHHRMVLYLHRSFWDHLGAILGHD